MFLDEKLYQHTINRIIENPDDFKSMVNELYRICEDHWKAQLHLNMTYSNGKILLDRTFASWDLFIKKLEKENYFLLNIISKYSYKSAFMEDEKAVRIYNLGKQYNLY